MIREKMSRCARIALIAVALFGLQAPLCAYACPPGDAQPVSLAAGDSMPPCHQAEAEPPLEPAPSAVECCDGETVAVASGELPKPSALAVRLPVQASVRPVAPVATSHGFAFDPRRLPAPDVLLAKSTLLI